jgi:hypothetical protein
MMETILRRTKAKAQMTYKRRMKCFRAKSTKTDSFRGKKKTERKKESRKKRDKSDRKKAKIRSVLYEEKVSPLGPSGFFDAYLRPWYASEGPNGETFSYTENTSVESQKNPSVLNLPI